MRDVPTRQENLLRKYLSYTEPSRAAVSVADLTMAITRDVPELIQEGFMSLHRTQHKFLWGSTHWSGAVKCDKRLLLSYDLGDPMISDVHPVHPFPRNCFCRMHHQS